MRGAVFGGIFLGFSLAAGNVLAVTAYDSILKKIPQEMRKIDSATEAGLNIVLERMSRALLGKPYLVGPLGEDSFDPGHPKPLYRIDAFDCTTYIETVMANAFCFHQGLPAAPCLEKTMQRIRYAGAGIGYRERNHIPELDWLPNNVKRGYLREETDKIFPGEVKQARITIDRNAWLASQGITDLSQGTGANEKSRSLYYLPIAFFFEEAKLDPAEKAKLEAEQKNKILELDKKLSDPKLGEADREEFKLDKFRTEMEFLKKSWLPKEDKLRSIPSGSILNLVRGELPRNGNEKLVPLVVHQGLVLQKPEGSFIRHAAPNIGHVSEQRLSDYLVRYLKSAKARGITIFRVLPQK